MNIPAPALSRVVGREEDFENLVERDDGWVEEDRRGRHSLSLTPGQACVRRHCMRRKFRALYDSSTEGG